MGFMSSLVLLKLMLTKNCVRGLVWSRQLTIMGMFESCI